MQTLIFGWLLESSLYAATRILQAIRIASWQDVPDRCNYDAYRGIEITF